MLPGDGTMRRLAEECKNTSCQLTFRFCPRYSETVWTSYGPQVATCDVVYPTHDWRGFPQWPTVLPTDRCPCTARANPSQPLSLTETGSYSQHQTWWYSDSFHQAQGSLSSDCSLMQPSESNAPPRIKKWIIRCRGGGGTRGLSDKMADGWNHLQNRKRPTLCCWCPSQDGRRSTPN